MTVEDDCAGITPDSMGNPVSKVVPSNGYKIGCLDATADGQGNVVVNMGGLGQHTSIVYAADATERGIFVGDTPVEPEASGFQGLDYSQSSNWLYQRDLSTRTPEGQVISRVHVFGDFSALFSARTGGSVAISTDSYACPHGLFGTSTLEVYRFAESGALISVVDIGGQGCPVDSTASVLALSDDRNNTLVVLSTGSNRPAFGFPAGRIIARWLDANGTSLTAWFDLSRDWSFHVAPLIGGGAALSLNGKWAATLPSGVAQSDPPPSFLKDDRTFSVIRGGRGYATFPRAGMYPAGDQVLDLYSASGKHCGELNVPSASQVSIGLDGTVIGLAGNEQCTTTWWPHLLR